jgi:hypothetical protein
MKGIHRAQTLEFGKNLLVGGVLNELRNNN